MNSPPATIRPRLRLRAARLGLLLALPLSLFAAEPAATVRTNDGFALSLGRDGRPTAIHVGEHAAPLATAPALFRLRDAGAKSEAYERIALAVTSVKGGLKLKSSASALDLDLSATISSQGGYLQLDGEVAARGAVDRCVDLKISLPIDMTGFALGPGLFDGPPGVDRKKKSARSRATDDLDESGSDDNSWYPLCPISNRASGIGLSLAVPPTHPTRFLVGADATGAFIVLRIGISQAAATPGRTPFRLIAYRHDAAWGFRSALARYYDFYREAFFARRVKRIGAWTTQNASKLANPQLYAYHEAGFPTWRHPAGTETGINVKLTLEQLDEGPVARSLDEYERICELALDEKHGIYSLPYTIVGQRQLLQLPGLPRGYDEAMRVLDTWTRSEPILFDGPPQAVSFRSVEELKTIIRNSTLHDPQHRLAFLARPYRGPTLTFPQNPNPNLFRGEGRNTIASYTLDYYLPMMLQSKFVDGLYLDSLGRWCSYYNYRTDHFKYSTVPLTYQGKPAQVCLWNLQSTAEYMWEARKRLHAQGKILMANGVHPDRVMLGFACDVMGGEGAPAYVGGEGFYALRVAAGLKPYCLLNASHRVSARLWNSCLYLGYLMGCNAGPGLADEAKYLPLVIRCNEAGWQPVTHARASPAVVGVERWGGQNQDAPLLFTVMNRSLKPVSTRVSIDLTAVNRTADVRASALIDGVAVDAKVTGRQCVLQFNLGPEQATVLELRTLE